MIHPILCIPQPGPPPTSSKSAPLKYRLYNLPHYHNTAHNDGQLLIFGPPGRLTAGVHHFLVSSVSEPVSVQDAVGFLDDQLLLQIRAYPALVVALKGGQCRPLPVPQHFNSSSNLWSVCIAASSHHLASGDSLGGLTLYSSTNLEPCGWTGAHGKLGAVALEFTPDGLRLVSAGSDEVVKVYTVGPDLTFVAQLALEHPPALLAVFAVEDRVRVVVAQSTRLVLWDPDSHLDITVQLTQQPIVALACCCAQELDPALQGLVIAAEGGGLVLAALWRNGKVTKSPLPSRHGPHSFVGFYRQGLVALGGPDEERWSLAEAVDQARLVEPPSSSSEVGAQDSTGHQADQKPAGQLWFDKQEATRVFASTRAVRAAATRVALNRARHTPVYRDLIPVDGPEPPRYSARRVSAPEVPPRAPLAPSLPSPALPPFCSAASSRPRWVRKDFYLTRASAQGPVVLRGMEPVP